MYHSITTQLGRQLFKMLILAMACLLAACSSSSQTSEQDEAGQDSPESPEADSTGGGQTEAVTEYRLWDSTPEVCEEILWVRVVADTAVFDCDGSELVGFDLATGEVSWQFAISDQGKDDFSWELIGVAEGNVGLVITEWVAPEGLSAGTTTTEFVLLDAISGDTVAREAVFEGAVDPDDRQTYETSAGVARIAGVFVVAVNPSFGSDEDPTVMAGFGTEQGLERWIVKGEFGGVDNVTGSIVSVTRGFADNHLYDAETGSLLELSNALGGLSEYGNALVLQGEKSLLSANENDSVLNTETDESFEIVAESDPVAFVDGYLLLTPEESLSFREFDGEVRWETGEGVVDSFGAHFPGDASPWIVVTNNAGEDIVLDPLTGEEIPGVSLDVKYYGDWAVKKSKETGFTVFKQA